MHDRLRPPGPASTAHSSSVELLPARTSLQVEAPGFQETTQQVTVGAESARADVVLQIAGFAETVAVVARSSKRSCRSTSSARRARADDHQRPDPERRLLRCVAGVAGAGARSVFSPPEQDRSTTSRPRSRVRAHEILWLVDGVRISNRLYNGTTPLDTLPAHMVERIEIIEGGPGALLRHPGRRRRRQRRHQGVYRRTGRESARRVDKNYGRHVNVFARDALISHRFVLYGSSDEADGFDSFPADEIEPSTTDRERSYDVLNFGGKYAYDFSKQLVRARYTSTETSNSICLQRGRSSAGQVGRPRGAFNERDEAHRQREARLTRASTSGVLLKGYFHLGFVLDEREMLTRTVGARHQRPRVLGIQRLRREPAGEADADAGFEYFAGYDFQNYRARTTCCSSPPSPSPRRRVRADSHDSDLIPERQLSARLRLQRRGRGRRRTVWNATGTLRLHADRCSPRPTSAPPSGFPTPTSSSPSTLRAASAIRTWSRNRSTNVNGSVGDAAVPGDTTVHVEVVGFYRTVTDLIVDIDDGSGETTITANQPDEVKVRGLSLVGSATLTSALTGSLALTYTNSERRQDVAGGYSSIPGIPDKQFQASLDLHPESLPFGAMLTVNRVGSMFDTVSGFGNVPSGEYTVVDLFKCHVFADEAAVTASNLRLENLFDEVYTTRHARGFPDSSSTPFLVHTLGVPRTFHMSYSFSY